MLSLLPHLLPRVIAQQQAVLFQSNWDTDTGNTPDAVTDGGRWPNYWEFNHGTNQQLLTVVPGGPNGHNALRVVQHGPSLAANLQIDNFIAPSRDYYLRLYMRNDDTSGAGDHVVTVDTYQYPNLTFVRKFGDVDGWKFVSSMYGCGYTYPVGHWGSAGKLNNGRWYRLEFFVHFTDATHVQMYPLVIDDNETLALTADQFEQSSYGLEVWNGRNDWTLGSYYESGRSFCVDPAFVNDFGIGNNGQQGAADTGRAWYFAAIEIRTDRWPGPVSKRVSQPLLLTRPTSSR